MTIALSIPLIVFFLVMVGIFAGAETGLVCLDLNNLKQLAKAENAFSERNLLRIAKQPDRFLALTLIGINMSIVIATSLATEIFQRVGPLGVSI